MKQWTMRKKLASGVLAVSVLAGGGAAAALLAGGVSASAAPSTAATTATSGPSFVPFPLQQLVENGTITQVQTAAVHNAMFQYVQDNRPAFGSSGTTPPMLEPNGPLASVLAQLVKNDTITQAEATAITKALSSQASAHFGSGPGAASAFGPPMMGASGFVPPWASSSSS